MDALTSADTSERPGEPMPRPRRKTASRLLSSGRLVGAIAVVLLAATCGGPLVVGRLGAIAIQGTGLANFQALGAPSPGTWRFVAGRVRFRQPTGVALD